jgi:hypothetical protein
MASSGRRDVAAARISTDRFIWSVKRLLDGFIRPAGGAG